MPTRKFKGIQDPVNYQVIDTEPPGPNRTVYFPANGATFWTLMSNAKSTYGEVDYQGVPGDLMRNADTAGRILVGWRGDSRSPDQIFANGFAARGTNPASPSIIYRTKDQDIAHYSAVCLTGSLRCAALFPLLVPNTTPPAADIWLYAIRLRGPWCPTYVLQQTMASRVGTSWAEYVTRAKNNLYGREAALPGPVSGQDVLAAIQVRRTWAGESYAEGGTYRYLALRTNNAAAPDNQTTVGQIQSAWTDKNLQGKTRNLPKPPA